MILVALCSAIRSVLGTGHSEVVLDLPFSVLHGENI